MLVGQPLQQVGRLVDLVGVERRWVAAQLGDDVLDLGVHLAPVLDRLPDVAEHPLDVLDDHLGVVTLGQPIDLDVHPRLADRFTHRLEAAVRDRSHRLEDAGDVADHVEAAGG